jgi:cell division protein FtsB
MGTSYYREISNISGLSDKVDAQMTKLISMSRTIQEYQEKVDYYSTPEGVARLAREEFNFVYPGEKIYRIVSVSSDVLPEKKQ